MVWTRRWALEMGLNCTDFDDGISQDMVMDLLLVGEGKGPRMEGPQQLGAFS